MSSPIYVAIIGVGLVGSEFISQLLSLSSRLASSSSSQPQIKLISLTSSTRTLYTGPESPFGLKTHGDGRWKQLLSSGTSENADLDVLTDRLTHLVGNGQGKVVLVDNTSSEDVAKRYPGWLKKGINVITPNKKAFSGEKELYDEIISSSSQLGGSNARALNESTVGAGLPVISTLRELLLTGDKVLKIEGVFSGTMSYIFNEFSTGKPDGPSFSSIVRVAREKGYTEPHPADDLNGYDVARKLTILSRTISTYSTSTSKLPPLQSFLSVRTASLIPPALEGISTGDEFLSRLPEYDDKFSEIRKKASEGGKVLRFVGIVDVETGEVRAGLEKYPIDHPFATSLGGSDNIVMFHTERYNPRPLIVQGAGAGAAVTAMGVLGDLLKLS
ncbi:aspartate kinase homoserine dehydrogenase [Pluteus cervinus]|uniref:Aspartate kinase homoserine dehydrogenase n=1 Tax=Pluteus cervinus TaxID=181527 RepID=A0ACD3B5L2_9AGAR|nr:aspartate kinase homoserine dehydrogenase [Pluteus cervinus]